MILNSKDCFLATESVEKQATTQQWLCLLLRGIVVLLTDLVLLSLLRYVLSLHTRVNVGLWDIIRSVNLLPLLRWHD